MNGLCVERQMMGKVDGCVWVWLGSGQVALREHMVTQLRQNLSPVELCNQQLSGTQPQRQESAAPGSLAVFTAVIYRPRGHRKPSQHEEASEGPSGTLGPPA